MKRKTYSFYLLIAALIIVLLSVTACQNLFNQPETGAQTGKLALSINNTGGRTILPPANTSFTKYALDFYIGQAATPAKSVELTDPSDVVDLNPGTYRLEVTGFVGNNATAKGTINSITISAGQTTNKSVILTPFTGGTVKGIFSWDLTAFTGASSISIVVGTGTPLTTAAGTQQLDADKYTVVFTVVAEGKTITWRSILYIYPGLTSSCVFDPDSANNFTGGGEIGDSFTISGTLADSENDVDAKFYASEVSDIPSPSPLVRSARSLMPLSVESEEVALEGLLEDGSITFKLRGTYNKTTKDYILSAAASFMRYSISGNTQTEESSAVVQIKAGSNWLSFTVSEVTVESNETNEAAPEITGTVEEDTLDDGIPKDMWGVWWGLESLQKSKDDIVQPRDYYYVLDAYTIKQYVNRHGIWNLESYTCFFEGATVENGIAKGRVEFNYTDQAAIDNSTVPAIKNWWINHLIAYAAAKWNTVPGGLAGDSARIAEVLDDANQGWKLWGDASWTAVLNRYKAPAQGDDGPLGTNHVWNSHFGSGTGFSYTAYRNDAYRIYNGQLQFGRYYAANGVDYFDKDPANITGFTKLVWGAAHSRDAGDVPSAPTSQIITGTLANGLTIPAEVTAIMHNEFQEKSDVLQVISGAHWSVLDYNLESFTVAKKVTFDVSMDVWLGTDARIAWQVNQGAYKSQKAYPVIAGSDVSVNPVKVYEAGKWHKIQGQVSDLVVASGRFLYLSAMQILITDTDINAATSLVENEIYLANVEITAILGDDVEQDPPLTITGNLGNYAYPGIYEGSDIVGYDYNRASWGLSGDNLKKAKADDAVLELVFTEVLSSLVIVWGAEGNWWNDKQIVTGGVGVDGVTYNKDTGKLTIELPKALAEFDLFRTASYANLIILNWNVFNINELGMASANLSGTIKAEGNITVQTVFDQDSNLDLYASVNENELTVYLYDENDYGSHTPVKTFKVYINGQLKTGTVTPMDVAYKIDGIDVSALSPGAHSGIIVVTIDSTVLSQKFNFMVTE